MPLTNTVEGFRLSPQQRRLWTLQQRFASRHGSFCAQLVMSFEGTLRLEALRDAVERVCRRHEALRTRFRRVAGVSLPVQSTGEMAFSWEALDLHGLDPLPGHERQIQELVELERRREFDYENGPLVYAKLLSLAPERHVLSITIPSLCADRRTLSNFFSELARAYELEADDEQEDEPLPYVQFSEWQNSLAEEEDAEKAREFWAQQDLEATSVALPGQHSRLAKLPEQRSTAEQTAEAYESLSIWLSLSTDQTARVAKLADHLQTTSATVLLAAWQTLLWRFAQQSIVIGNVCDGRSYDLLDGAFGLFARVLPVCTQLNERLQFSELVKQVDGFQGESEEWQDYFYDCDAADKRFAFGFEYAEVAPPVQKAGLRIEIEQQHCAVEPFDLKLTCLSKDSGLHLSFAYNAAALDDTYVRHLASAFETLLDGALATPDMSIDELELVSAAEKQRIVLDWNNTSRDYSLDHCVHELFEQQVARTPDALAAVFQDQQLTFAELNARANQVAHYLRGQSIGPDVAVGICIEPSLEMIVAVFGVFKADGAYVPIDRRNPEERIRQLTRDAKISILLTQEGVIGAARESSDKFQTDTRPENLADTRPENLAYVIYTSGSTGQPKGVMVQHRSVINLAAALREQVYEGFGSRLKIGLSAPLAFDASVKQLIQLLHGHTLHILPEELRLDAARALEYVDRNGIDALDCTPSQLKLLLAAGLNRRREDGKHDRTQHEKHIPKLILVGGEALDEATWSQLAEDRRTHYFNVYGPTESTVDATWTGVTSQTQPTIGRPIPNTRAYILDRHLKPTGVHVAGELYLGGAGLARGYLNSPERTAERFVPDHLGCQPGARLYRTGDLARYTADGAIVFTGRNDAQVKVRGHRIELGEIEAALREHEHVREAVVVARTDKADVRLVGYVIPANSHAPDTTELKRMLSGRLPDYMLPSFLVVLDELPLTRNGKVDLQALPAPETVKTSREENYLAPRNEIEATITRVWQDVLGVERIGVNDNFFDAGGHSLLMVQAHNKLSERFAKNISLVEMFAKPTISALAEHFSETNGHKPTFEKVMDRAARRRQAAGLKSVP